MFDYLVVGAGLFGSVFARLMAEFGNRVLLIEHRSHTGGNCHTERVEGIAVHKYGPHVFHTNNESVWRFVNKFAAFNNFALHTKANPSRNGRLFSFPINLMTLHQVWGVSNPADAATKLHSVRCGISNPRNAEEWALSQLGHELYELFIEGYTTKQWGRHPSEVPVSIVQRIPIRLTFDDRYFDERFQGVPVGGYSEMFNAMLDHPNIETEIGVDFFTNRNTLQARCRKVVYTGKLDEFYDYRFGKLEYRSLRFETEVRDGDFQGTAIINHTSRKVPYTRVVEHKHFEYKINPKTVITREYPEKEGVPCYPIRDATNLELVERYSALSDGSVIFGGRLATYQYYDMHQVVAQAMKAAEKETRKSYFSHSHT